MGEGLKEATPDILTILVVEIDQDENAVSPRIQSLFVCSELRRQLVEETSPTDIRTLVQIPRQLSLSLMFDHHVSVAGLKARQKLTQECPLGRPLDQDMDPHASPTAS